MKHASHLQIARLAAIQIGAPVIVVDIEMIDSQAISRLPVSLPLDTCTALYRGPQMLVFDNVAGAVKAFNTLVDETLDNMNLDYVITMTNGVDQDVVHSNIFGRGDPNGHPRCEMDGDDAWTVSYPSES